MESLVFYPWYWLVLGFALIALESLGAGGFLLGGALAGVLMGLLTWLKGDLHWSTQVITFGFLTVIFTLLYWRFFKRFNQKTDNPVLNNRAAQLHGRTLTLEIDLPEREGRIQIGDTLWKVKSNQALKKGSHVIIHDSDDTTLLIKKIDNET